MRIIDTVNKSPVTSHQSPVVSHKFKSLISVLLFYFLLLPLLSGCTQNDSLKKAQEYIQQSQKSYQEAVSLYKDLLIQGKDPDKLHLELGKLYYAHGEYALAVSEFKMSNIPEAKKFLAISYYRMSDFTDALEVFNTQEIKDDEYQYYHGLTCEKLNLFDQALDIYQKIKEEELASLALTRMRSIEKQISATHLKDADPKTYEILNNAPDEALYPQAGALVLSCDEDIQNSPQNTQVATLHYLIKILNERGKENFSETHIEYDSTYEKVELEYARTIRPDGTILEVGTRHIRDVSKYLNFPLYSNARVYIISFPEVAEGAAIEYKVKIYRSQFINKKDFMINYGVQESEPVISANLDIALPKDKAIRIKVLNDKYNNFKADLKAKTGEKDGRLTYSWGFKDIPQIIPESNMPAAVEINPTLLISSFESWENIYQWWWDLAKDRISADSAIKDKVKELTQGLSSDEERAGAIYNFCAQKIRYVAVEYGQAGYQPHFAYDIFKNKYGDCKDQAILLVTMLKEAGLKGYPVLISTKEYYNLNPDFPAVFFNHCIASVLLKDTLIFLDPTAETCSFGDLPPSDQGRKVLVFKEDGYEIKDTPLHPAEHNSIRQSIQIKINADESIEAKKTVSTAGMYDQAQRYWLLYTPPELIQEQIQERLQDISIGAKLDDYHIKNIETLDNPVILDYAFRGSEYLTLAGPIRIMPQLSMLDAALVSKGERKYPIDFAVLDTKEINLEVELPEGMSVKYLPSTITEESPWLKFSAEYNRVERKIFFRQKIELKKINIPESEYAQFKVFFEGLARKIKQRIVLEGVAKDGRKR